MADEPEAAAAAAGVGEKEAGPPNPEWPIKDKEGFITVPFAYGSVAFWQGKRAAEFQTHKWHVYVRGANNEDLTHLIERVIFQLHPSFNNPTRVVDTAPFHVSELGWGEFEIVIKIFLHEGAPDFRDVARLQNGPEQGLELRHMLALWPKSGEPSMKRAVVSEKHDELVFNEPSESLLQRIHMSNSRLINAGKAWGEIESLLGPPNEEEEVLRMEAAQRRVQAETAMLLEEYEKEEQGLALAMEDVKRLEAGQGKKAA